MEARCYVKIFNLTNNFTDRFNALPLVETSYLNTDMCKFESLQKDETEPNWLIPGKLAANLGHLRR